MYEYNVTYPNEMYHHGIKGMKWGVRRYQNKDGTLTPAGKKRAQKDADKLSGAMEKHLDSTNDFQRSLSRVYLVDKNGFNRWDSDGKGYFDTNGGVTKYNANKLSVKNRNQQAYLDVKKAMEKTYDSVKVDAKYDIATGKATSKIVLEKHGERFVSEITKDYGTFDTSKQIEFRPMFKD